MPTPYYTKFETDAKFIDIKNSEFLGTAGPTDTPSGTGANYWEVIVSGTYTNFGGVVLPANNRGLIYRNPAGAFSISHSGLDLTEYAKVFDINKIKNNLDFELTTINKDTAFLKKNGSGFYLQENGVEGYNAGWTAQYVSDFIRADKIHLISAQDSNLSAISGYSSNTEASFLESIAGRNSISFNEDISIIGAKYYRIGINTSLNATPSIIVYLDKSNADELPYINKILNKTESYELSSATIKSDNKAVYINESGVSIVNKSYLSQFTTEFIRADKIHLTAKQDTDIYIIAGYLEANDASFISALNGLGSSVLFDKEVEIVGAKYYKIGINNSYLSTPTATIYLEKSKIDDSIKDVEVINDYLKISKATEYDSTSILAFGQFTYLDSIGVLQKNLNYTAQRTTDFIRADKIHVLGSQDGDIPIVAAYSEANEDSFLGYFFGDGIISNPPIVAYTTDRIFKVDGAKYYRVNINAEYLPTPNIKAFIVSGEIENLRDEIKNSKEVAIIQSTQSNYGCENIVPFNKLSVSAATKQGIVLAFNPSSSYMNSMVESPCIFYEPSLSKLVMLHTCYNTDEVASIGYATSTDGIAWTEQGQFFVPSVPDNELGLTGPVMVIWENKYYFYYIGLTEVGYEAGEITLNLATANTFAEFVNNTAIRHGVQLSKGSGWYADAIYHPNFIQAKGIWYMFINCLGRPESKERVGYATSENIMGPWVLQDQPLDLLDNERKIISNHILSGDPSLYEMDGYYIMSFFMLDVNDNAKDYWAYTSKELFPEGWKYGGQSVDTDQSYDSQHAHKPYCIKFNGKLFHYYTSVSNANGRNIALQISDL